MRTLAWVATMQPRLRWLPAPRAMPFVVFVALVAGLQQVAATAREPVPEPSIAGKPASLRLQRAAVCRLRPAR